MSKAIIEISELHFDLELTLKEVCHACMIHPEFILELVDLGLIEPKEGEIYEWPFHQQDFKRIKLAKRLRQDLKIESNGLALVVELLEEIEQLKKRVENLEDR